MANSNVFYNLEASDYTFYVKYADSDCYGDSIKGKIFNLKNAFHQNGDGINDYWRANWIRCFPVTILRCRFLIRQYGVQRSKQYRI